MNSENKNIFSLCWTLIFENRQVKIQIRMGQAHHENAIENEYEIIKKKSDESLLLKHKQTKGQYLLRTFCSTIEDEISGLHDILQKRRKIKSLHLLELVKIRRVDEKQTCSTTSRMNLLIEYPFKTLADEIQERRVIDNYFDEEELWSILYSCCVGLNTLYINKLNHESLDSHQFYISRQGLIKLSDPLLLGLEKNYIKNLKKQSQEYGHISPEVMNFLDDCTFSYYDKQRSDIFVLGTIMIEASLLKKVFLYDRDGKKPALNQIPDLLHQIGKRYSRNYKTLLEEMMSLHSKMRPNFKQILTKIQSQHNIGGENNGIQKKVIQKNSFNRKESKLKMISPSSSSDLENKKVEIKDRKTNKLSHFAPINSPVKSPTSSLSDIPKLTFTQTKSSNQTFTKAQTGAEIKSRVQESVPNSQDFKSPQKPFINSYGTTQISSNGVVFPSTMNGELNRLRGGEKKKKVQDEEKIKENFRKNLGSPVVAVSSQKKLEVLHEDPVVSSGRDEALLDKYGKQNGLKSMIEPLKWSLVRQSQSKFQAQHNKSHSHTSTNKKEQTFKQTFPKKEKKFDSLVYKTLEHPLENSWGKGQRPKKAVGPVYVCEIYENGEKYEGFKENGKRNGKGKVYFRDGGAYDGDWKNDSMWGFGVLFYDNGQVAYEGQWEEDEFCGRGRAFNYQPERCVDPFNYIDFAGLGDKWYYYEGEFKGDSKHGRGKIQLTNGEVFEGSFFFDAIEGSGTFYPINSQPISGYWQDNMLIPR